MLKHRRWGGLNSLINKLPKDTGQTQFKKGTSGINLFPNAGSKVEDKNIREAINAIYQVFPNATPEAIGAILGNLSMETLTNGAVTEGNYSNFDGVRARSDWPSINNNINTWIQNNGLTEASAKTRWINLPKEAKLGIMYNADPLQMGGGVGALQITGANYGGLENTYPKLLETANKLFPEEGFKSIADVVPFLENNYDDSVKLSLQYYKDNMGLTEDELNTKYNNPRALRKIINPWEDLSADKSTKQRAAKMDAFGKAPVLDAIKEYGNQNVDMVNEQGQTKAEWDAEREAQQQMAMLDASMKGRSTQQDAQIFDNTEFVPYKTKANYINDINKQKVEEARVKAEDFNNNLESLGVFNRKTKRGSEASALNQGLYTAANAMNPGSFDWANKLALNTVLGVKEGVENLWNSAFGDATLGDYGGERQESGFTNDEAGKAMRTQMESLVDWMQHGVEGREGGDITWMPMDAMRSLTAARDKALFGQDTEGSAINWISEILSTESTEDAKQILQQAFDQGILDERGLKVAQHIINNPEDFYSSQMESGMALDLVTMAANPEGVVNALKLGGKGLVAGGKLTGKGLKAVVEAPQWKKAWDVLKSGPRSVYNKAIKQVSDSMKTTTAWDDIADMEQAQKVLDDVVADAKKSGKASKAVIADAEKSSNLLKKSYNFVKSMPEKFRASLSGQSVDEIQKAAEQMSTITGKSTDELVKMKPADVQKLVNNKAKSLTDDIANATSRKKKAWSDWRQSSNSLDEYQKEIKRLNKMSKKGPEWQKNMETAKQSVANAERNVNNAMDGLEQATKDKDLLQTNWDQIAKLEDVQGSKEFGDKWRVIDDTEKAIQKHLDEVTRLDAENIDPRMKAYATQEKASVDALNKANKEYDLALKEFNKAKKAGLDTGPMKTRLDNAKKAKELAAGRGLAAQEDVKRAKAAKARFNKLAKDYPKAMQVLSKDAKAMEEFVSGTLTVPQLVQVLRRGGDEEIKIDEIQKSMEDFTDLTPTEIERAKKEKVGGDGTSDTGGTGEGEKIDWEKKFEELSKYKPGESVIPAGEDYGGGSKGGPVPEKSEAASALAAITDNMGTFAEYLPVVNNLKEGLQSPDEVNRNFVSPQTEVYRPNSQSEQNAIDEAFGAAMANARNLSGGSAANYRANTEAAAADKIRRTGELGTREAARADQIANRNVNASNRAREYNAGVRDRADLMDMKSGAATNQFWQQGLQDISNISQRNRKDKRLQENQDLMLNMMGYGRDFDMNGFKGGNGTNVTGTGENVTPNATAEYPGEAVAGMTRAEWENAKKTPTTPSTTEAQKLRLQTELGTYPSEEKKKSTWSAMDGLSNGISIDGSQASTNALGTNVTTNEENLLSNGMNANGGFGTMVENNTTNLDEQEAEGFGLGSV